MGQMAYHTQSVTAEPSLLHTYASTYKRFAIWLALYAETDQAPVAAFTADARADYLDQLEDTKSPATVKRNAQRSTDSPNTCTPSARSTPPRS